MFNNFSQFKNYSNVDISKYYTPILCTQTRTMGAEDYSWENGYTENALPCPTIDTFVSRGTLEDMFSMDDVIVVLKRTKYYEEEIFFGAIVLVSRFICMLSHMHDRLLFVNSHLLVFCAYVIMQLYEQDIPLDLASMCSATRHHVSKKRLGEMMLSFLRIIDYDVRCTDEEIQNVKQRFVEEGFGDFDFMSA